MKNLPAMAVGSFVVLCLSLACGRRDDNVGDNPIVITYLHQTDSARYVGTVLSQGGFTTAVWSVTREDRKESQESDISDATMAELWKGLSEIEDFRQFAVADLMQPADSHSGHIVVVLSGSPGQRDARAFLIPSESASAESKEWLVLAGLPNP